MVARLAGIGESSGPAPSPAPSSPPERPAAPPSAGPPLPWLPPTAPVRPVAAPSAPAGSSRAGSRSSPDVPAPSSLADLFGSAAAAVPHPASAAAAASVAAAIAAVDDRDVLSLDRFVLPLAPAPGQRAAASPPQGSQPAAQQAALPLGELISFAGAPSALDGAAGPAERSLEEPASSDPVEVAKAAPTDPPPELVQGDDDIYWLSRLHASLEAKGFFPGDDDMENWFFGETTAAAVLSFQASERLPETGVVDRATWTALLGAEVAEELFSKAAATAATAEPAAGPADSSTAASAEGTGPAAASSAARQARPAGGPAGAGEQRFLDKWPVLMEGDGGREVHALQVALSEAGFYAGEDDMRWWQFGDTTLTALKFFQSCNALPESGVCDERVWRKLLGEAAQPVDLYDLRLAANSDDEADGFDEDLDGVSQGRVWLLGEQRWERRA